MSHKLQSTLIAFAMLILITFAIIGFVLMGLLHPLPWICVALVVGSAYLQQHLTDKNRIVWDESLAVGVEMIDNDHKKLFELLDRFHSAAIYQKGEQFENAALKELLDYTIEHFTREEEEMEATNYPHIEEHKRQHREMKETVEDMAKNYGPNSAEELAIFLRDWLNNHIRKTDTELSKHLKK